MLVKRTYLPKLDNDELNDHILRAKTGDKNAMFRLSRDTLKFHAKDEKYVENMFWLITKVGHGYNVSILANLACMAVIIKEYDLAFEAAEMGLREEYLATAYVLHTWTDKGHPGKIHEQAMDLLRRSAIQGYFPARKQVFSLKVQKFGVLGKVLTFVYSLYLIPQIIIVSIKNRNDPRINYSY